MAGRYSTVSDTQRVELWRRYRAGETVRTIAQALAQQPSNLYRVLEATGRTRGRWDSAGERAMCLQAYRLAGVAA